MGESWSEFMGYIFLTVFLACLSVGMVTLTILAVKKMIELMP